jgi:Na+-translocating ferredoxin:NAD+ oxidoreductase RNF subunit RnfB
MINFQDLMTPILIFAVIGVVAGILLAVASKVFSVKEEERFEAVRDALPGINCGVCGFKGCDEYAKKVAGKDAKPALCIPGGQETAQAISEVMGLPYEGVASRVAIVHCGGDYDATSDKYDYKGALSCAASNLFYDGRARCKYGCIGFGDCAAACPVDAIRIENGLAIIDKEKCTGCMICVTKCPKKLIEPEFESAAVVVACNSKDSGKVTRENCKNGCTACLLCEKACEYDAIKVVDNVAVIDYHKCNNCYKCAEVCPTGCIRIFTK